LLKKYCVLFFYLLSVILTNSFIFVVMKQLDSFRHKGLRRRLVDELREKGITDQIVLDAIGKVPRHLFMDSSFVKYAYRDAAFPIGSGQTISQPYTVAFQSQLLKVNAGCKVLEVGTGSGYQAAVLAEMGVDLYSIERQSSLYKKCKTLLPAIGYPKIRLFLGDGYAGLPEFEPFDAILVTAGALSVPRQLLLQLRVGGLLVVPVGRKVQEMTRVVRLSDDEFEQQCFGSFQFVPLLRGTV
jgi:protein-L-isoaspartate(D-aspartate) O-methyltransferase